MSLCTSYCTLGYQRCVLNSFRILLKNLRDLYQRASVWFQIHLSHIKVNDVHCLWEHVHFISKLYLLKVVTSDYLVVAIGNDFNLSWQASISGPLTWNVLTCCYPLLFWQYVSPVCFSLKIVSHITVSDFHQICCFSWSHFM